MRSRLQTFPLWPDEAPGALGKSSFDRPTLTSYPPKRANRLRAAMLVLPGGSYHYLAEHEGKGYARWLAAQGYHAFVLNYRLGSRGYRHPVMLADAARAVRFIRHHAARWQVAPDRIGVMGSSAGGHLAALLATARRHELLTARDAIDRESPRPGCAVLCYPVITMGPQAHAGCLSNLLGARPAPALRRKVSAERRVTPRTPPCFLWHTAADKIVPIEHSLLFARALRRHNVAFELHLYADGGHGLGLGRAHPWNQACLHWLNRHFTGRRTTLPA